MAKIEQYSRIINHAISTSGQSFTVPSSNDHTDETWLATDLYIGELGVNVTDDKVFVRTNNGIIQIATGTSSATAATTSTPSVFQFNSPHIQVGTTYSADSVSPRSGYYTDLGTSTYRWKDLYLGGSATTNTTINTNGGLWLKQSSDSILVTNAVSSTNAPIEIGTTASTTTKDRGLFLNSKSSTIAGTPEQNSVISSYNITINSGKQNVALGGADTAFSTGLTHSVIVGYGYGKTQSRSLDVVAGGGLSVRGISDDGSSQYNDSDWRTRQARLRTTNALTTNIVTIPWNATASGGEVVQLKAYLTGVNIADASQVYSAEISGAYSIDSSLTTYEIGTPIILEWNSFSTAPQVELGVDGNAASVKVIGLGSTTIQWLCSYSYHKMINVIP